MGKGKAKGWRPPPPGEDAGSTLYGSADHLSGDTIASPVQLREEGRALPRGHPNFGGRWNGKGKNNDASSSRTSLPADDHWRAPTAVANPYLAPTKLENPYLPAVPKVAATHRVPSHASAPTPPKFFAPVPKGSPQEPKLEGEAASEIEQRRLEEAATVDFEVRRAAAQARREQAATAAREAEARRHAGASRARAAHLQSAANADSAELAGDAKLEVKEEEAPADMSEQEPYVLQEPRADHDEDDATEAPVETEIERRRRLASLSKPAVEAIVAESKVEPPGEEDPARTEAENKRRRTDEEGGGGDLVAVARKLPAKSAAPSVAMQQGLQRWAERVNALAGDDVLLIKKCREFVRKRILKAHATGSLHATDWDDEPVPTAESIAEAS